MKIIPIPTRTLKGLTKQEKTLISCKSLPKTISKTTIKLGEKQTHSVFETFEAMTIFSSIDECSTDCSSEHVLFSGTAENKNFD
jgi:hypothetical protein